MSFLDPYASGDPNPDELNPYFMHWCVAGLVASAVAWLYLDNLMVRLVLAAVVIGLITAIAVRDIRQVDPDAPVAHDRDGVLDSTSPAVAVNQPLIRMPSRLRDDRTSRES